MQTADFSKPITNEEINGMLRLLNKIIWKIPAALDRTILNEASDMLSVNGTFLFDEKKEQIVFKKR